MARDTIRTTYSLSPCVVDRLERLARTWQVSKSEALSRAIAAAADADPPRDALAESLSALRTLQQAAQVSAPVADAWARDTRAERRRSRARLKGVYITDRALRNAKESERS